MKRIRDVFRFDTVPIALDKISMFITKKDEFFWRKYKLALDRLRVYFKIYVDLVSITAGKIEMLLTYLLQ